MPKIIASTYEINEKIGSGGGGIVYRGRHTRLGKDVVLKADRLAISAKPEVLRREVDSLKNLSHTYIPQVYDFIMEGETAYTVMDFIAGESLDKPLKRGERFPQKQVIEWSCQLLEALQYLHSRPPYGILHGDIKPANIMLTPQGDIRLIDFNIALALGEEGTAHVGYSRGYASPEHYGINYSSRKRYAARGSTEEETELIDGSSVSPRSASSASTGSGKRTLLLDVRSDIYSLGATLYHLLTGTRPPEDAKAVTSIHLPEISPAVSDIIQKAMAPDPDQRYQTAQEMLDAFEHLHENDPRMLRHKRQVRVVSALLVAIFLAGGICTFLGQRQMERTQAEAAEAARIAEEAERTAKQALAAVTASENACQNGNIQVAVASAMEALSLDSPYVSRAQNALTNALGVYDLSDGFKPCLLLELPSEPLKVELSPMGTHVAVMVSGALLVFDTDTGKKLTELPAEPSAWADMAFIDEDTILYAGINELCAFRLSSLSEIWTGATATEVVISGDTLRAAAIDRDENLAAIYDTTTGTLLKVVTFQNQRQKVAVNDVFIDPDSDLLSLNMDGTMLAVSFDNGALDIYDLRENGEDITLFPASDFIQFEGGFYGKYFALSASGSDQSVFAIIDTIERTQTGGFASSDASFHAHTTPDGIYISSQNVLVSIHPETGEQTEVAYTNSDITHYDISTPYVMTATSDGLCSFFDWQAELLETHSIDTNIDFAKVAGEIAIVANSNSPSLHILKLETHTNSQLFSYDRDYSHYEARLSSDESTIMLFRNDQFRLYSMNGSILDEKILPDAGQIYDQQYRKNADENFLEVIYNDGTVHTYSAQDGRLISSEKREEPDRTLYEEFVTNDFRIERPLHGTPVVYNRETGEQVGVLEDESYLTYVTQVGEYIITEYMTAHGERYGLLLNKNLETLAKLPGLCDITPDGRLIFDDMRGNLRQCHIYSAQELLELAKNI